MFQGNAVLTLDAKGRLAVPTKHRDALLAAGRTVVLTAHVDSCLLLYPGADWKPIRERVQSLSAFDDRARWWNRLIVGYAEEIELDAQGRILVSPSLREFASLSKDVRLVGLNDHFEIWDDAAWKEKLAVALPQVASSPLPGADRAPL